jgi:hypothetical protein
MYEGFEGRKSGRTIEEFYPMIIRQLNNVIDLEAISLQFYSAEITDKHLMGILDQLYYLLEVKVLDLNFRNNQISDKSLKPFFLLLSKFS